MGNQMGMTVRRAVTALAVAGLGLVSGPVQSAVLTVYSDLAGFTAAAGGPIATQDFSGYASGTDLSGVEFLPGISATTNMPSLQAFVSGSNTVMFGLGGRTGGTARYDITLAQPRTFIAFDIGSFEANNANNSMACVTCPGTLTVFFTDATSQALSFYGNPDGDSFFVGLGADSAITKITWAEALEQGGGNEESTLDNFRVVPEPTTMLLLALGLAGLGFSRRRKSVQA